MSTASVRFRAFVPGCKDYHKHVRKVRKAYTEKFDKASSIASYPSDWIVGQVTLESAKSLCERAIKLIEMGRKAYYTWPHSNNSSYYGQVTVWSGVLAYITAEDKERNAFDRFGGVNNPFLTGRAKLVN